MSQSMKDWCVIILFFFISVGSPIILYNCSKLDILPSLTEAAGSYFQFLKCEDHNPSDLLFNTSNLTTSAANASHQAEKRKCDNDEVLSMNSYRDCLPNTSILDFLTRQCSSIHVYLPNQNRHVLVNNTNVKNGSFGHLAAYSKEQQETESELKSQGEAEESKNHSTEFELHFDQTLTRPLTSGPLRAKQIVPSTPPIDEEALEGTQNDGEFPGVAEDQPKTPLQDDLTNRTHKINDSNSNSNNFEISTQPTLPSANEISFGQGKESGERVVTIEAVPSPPLEGEQLYEESHEVAEVFCQLGQAFKRTAVVLSNHAVQYPKDVCVVIVFVLFLIKLASWLSGEYRHSNPQMIELSPSLPLLSSVTGGSTYSDSGLVKPVVMASSATCMPHNLDSVRHLLPAESQPIIPCTMFKHGYNTIQTSSTSETGNVRGIPDTFTILKNMPADIDVADIYLDTFRRMAMAAGKVKTANLLKESQLFLEYRRNSYINNLSEATEGAATTGSSRALPTDSILANLSTDSQG